jgi:CubicO group peptidase (beta-lactamase class C family)
MASDVQNRVQKLIDGIVSRGSEQGIQVAAYWKGDLIVDAWAGLADPGRGTKVDGHTLFPVFSTTKAIAATTIHILAARGVLEYDRPIAHDWPGFGRNGKSQITLRQVLNHTAGLPHMPDCKALTELTDWRHMCDLIADLEPLWTPGTKTYYHAITFGWLVGEPACQATGCDFFKLVTEEISKPLGLEDSLFIGLPPSEDSRVAIFESDPNPPPTAPTAPGIVDIVAGRSIPPLVCPLENWINKLEARRGCIPASNGIMTAKAVAKHFAALIGQVDGVRLISEATLRKAVEGTRNGEPENVVRCLGYNFYDSFNNDRWSAFGHGGAGGSLGIAFINDQLAIGFAKNRMGTSAPETKSSSEQIVREIRNALKLE